jgi:pyruvate kinase
LRSRNLRFVAGQLQRAGIKLFAEPISVFDIRGFYLNWTNRRSIACGYTTSGSTSLCAARERPIPPILSMTPSLATARCLALVWGVHSVQTRDVSDVAEMVEHACRHAVAEEFAKQGDTILISAGMPFGTPGATNLLRIATV